MNFKHIIAITAIISLLLPGISANANQPYGGCWHPEDIKDWSPEKDKDAKFNRSRIPLQKRFRTTAGMPANIRQHTEGQICNATILYPRCSAAPSQGAPTFTAYQPTYWQYMDKLVYWAGSASEGIIIPPPAPTTDAAHLSGVKVLGQIFFPPTYYGGKREWVEEMLKTENGKHPYALKLFEIARYFGFDGWFINEETGGSSSSDWASFIKDFNEAADAAGFPDMEIMWYNARTAPDITILKAHKNTSQFLEYGAVGDKRSYASQIGCSESDIFSKLYSGIECAKAGLTGYNYFLNQAFPAGGHVGSVALFCPEEHSWKDNVRDILDIDDTGEKAYQAVKRVFNDEQTMWVNRSGDPSALNDSWRGISGAIEERSAITSVPFRSDMCVGVGKYRFVEGRKLWTGDWHHSGVQSVLPTWRWWIGNRGDLTVDIDWDNAYNMGNSFRVSGSLSVGDHLMRLYKTCLKIENDMVLEIAFKGETPQLALSTSESVNPDKYLDGSAAEITVKNDGWKTAKWKLAELDGKTVYMIGLNFKSPSGQQNFSFSLGALSVMTDGKAQTAPEIRNAVIESDLGQEKGDVRLSWDYDFNSSFDRFDIYVTDGPERKLAGQTRGEGFYLAGFERPKESNKLKIEIVPVTKDGKSGTPAGLEAVFPELEKSQVRIKPGKSYLLVGETTEITAKATNFPISYKWTVSSGLQPMTSLDGDKITVKALKEGHQQINVSVVNPSGTAQLACEAIDVLDNATHGLVENVVLKKKVVGYSSSANDREVPDKIIDGVVNPSSTSDKWCSLDAESWVTFDCGAKYRIYGFKIYDCKSGPENNENFHSFTIELSDDGKNWTKVVDETDRMKDNIKEDYIVPAWGRYIRFSPKVAGVLRVWEFEAYGLSEGAGITGSVIQEGEAEIKAIYSPDGKRYPSLQPGVNIVVYSDGKIRKVVGRY